MGVKPAEVSRKLSEAFTRMIFRHGCVCVGRGGGAPTPTFLTPTPSFVHCDPHAGNVLVRPREERTWWGGRRKRAQLVLLDHGLYREFGDDLRLEYARLWHGLVTVRKGTAAGLPARVCTLARAHALPCPHARAPPPFPSPGRRTRGRSGIARTHWAQGKCTGCLPPF